MPNCSLPKCKNRSSEGYSLYRVPKDVKLSHEWINFLKSCGVEKINENTRVCQDHFSLNADGLILDSVPTIYRNYVSRFKH